MADVRDELQQAIFALPRPVTLDQVLSTAGTVLGADSTKFTEFSGWLDRNGVVLLGKLNG